MADAKTIANLWRNAMAEGRPDPAYLHEVDGEWREVTWSEAAEAVDELANGLLAVGVQKGDSFALLARTSLEWALFDFALALVGAVGAPIYANSSERDTQYVLEHSQAVGVLVEDDVQRAKVSSMGLAHVIAFAELDELRARGRDYAATHPGALEARAASIDEDDLFTFIYTSGTTGPPKACMIRHRNYYDRQQRWRVDDDVVLRSREASASRDRICAEPSISLGFGGMGPAASTLSLPSPQGCDHLVQVGVAGQHVAETGAAD